MAKAFLEKQGVPYTSIDVGADDDAAQKMIALRASAVYPLSWLTMRSLSGLIPSG